MIKNHTILLINAIVLIALGVYGYFSSGSPTALIAPAIGAVLLGLSFPVKNENRTASHIAVGLTLIASIAFIIIGIRRGNAMVIGMGIFSFLCFDMYVLNFLLRKKKNNSAKV